ncbi:hypothetical protein HerbRD11066_11090 [Herbidospora sp. RD11066]
MRSLALAALLLSGVALDGKETPPPGSRWSVEVPGVLDFLPAGHDPDMFIVRADNAVTMVDGRTGRVGWERRDLGSVWSWGVFTSVVIVQTRVRGGPRQATTLRGLDLRSGRLLWTRSVGENEDASLSLVDSRTLLIWDSLRRELSGVDTESGAVLWRRIDCPDCTLEDVHVTEDIAAALLNDGTSLILRVFDPVTGALQFIRRFPLLESAYLLRWDATEGVVGGRTAIAVRDSVGIFFLDAAGSLVHEDRNCDYRCRFEAHGRHVVFLRDGHVLEGVDLGSGRVTWRRRLSGQPWSLTRVAAGVMVQHSYYPFGAEVVRPADGHVVDRVDVPAVGHPVVDADGRLYLVTRRQLPIWGAAVSWVGSVGDRRQMRPPPDGCRIRFLPGFSPVTPQPFRKPSACVLADASGRRLGVNVIAAGDHDRAAGLFAWHEDADIGIPLPGVGDEAFADRRRPRLIVARRGGWLVEFHAAQEGVDLVDLARRTLAGLVEIPPPAESAAGEAHPVGRTVLYRRESEGVAAFAVDGEGLFRWSSGVFERVSAFSGTLSAEGRWELSLGSGSVIEFTDHHAEASFSLRVVPRGERLTAPMWAADGRVLLTVVDTEDEERTLGFVVADPSRRLARYVDAAFDDSIDGGGFVWKNRDEVVGLSIDLVDGEYIPKLYTFGMDGKVKGSVVTLDHRLIPGRADALSPSGLFLAARCADASYEMCVLDVRSGRRVASLPYDPGDFGGWYDDDRVIDWGSDDYEWGPRPRTARLIDLSGLPSEPVAFGDGGGDIFPMNYLVFDRPDR